MQKKALKQLLNTKMHLLSAFKSLPTATNDAGDFIALPDVILPNSNDYLQLSLTFGGAGQVGSATVSLLNDKKFKDVAVKGSTDLPISIKPCNLLDGEEIILVAEVTDANHDPANNMTELIVEVRVGANTVYKDDHSISVSNEGDTARFTYKISCYVQ